MHTIFVILLENRMFEIIFEFSNIVFKVSKINIENVWIEINLKLQLFMNFVKFEIRKGVQKLNFEHNFIQFLENKYRFNIICNKWNYWNKNYFITALLISAALARPQRFPTQQFPGQQFPIQQFPGNIFFPGTGTGNGNGNGNIVTSTAAPTTGATVTTASPQYLACLQSCPSTMEYNPVCGSDNENYHNSGRLSCAQRCGKGKSKINIFLIPSYSYSLVKQNNILRCLIGPIFSILK